MKIDKNVNDEMLSALTNILSVEEHLLQESKIDITKIKDIREIRDNIIILLFGDNKNIFAKWCVLKHLLLSYEHILECIPKENDNNLKSILSDISLKIKKIIDEILFEIKNGKFEECEKCKTDLTKIYNSFKKIIGGN